MTAYARIFEARRLVDEPITLEQLADEFSVSRERVRQVELRAFEKVRRRAIQVVAAGQATAAPVPANKPTALHQTA